MNKMRIAVLLSCMLFSFSTSVFAEDALAKKFSDSQLIEMFKGEGYSSVEQIKDGVIRVKIESRNFVIFNKFDGDLQLYYVVGGAKISFETINEWNKSKRLSRAYLDSDNDPALEADLLADAGITQGQVMAFFNVFKMSVNAFRDFLIERNQK
ncbi:MAG: YbjN domain-containing protein [Gallionella sp.]|nr:YbjN domain-containing protein [Gallionella sp.]MDD4960002.1 YbjN domain-containing protein [Gallionella sp.]